MKAALITEKQIKAILETLYYHIGVLKDSVEDYSKTVALVKSLKVSEPVGYISVQTDYLSQDKHLVGAIDDQTLAVCTPLYAKEKP